MRKLFLIACIFLAAAVNAETKNDTQTQLDVEAELKKLETLQVENPATSAAEAVLQIEKSDKVGIAQAETAEKKADVKMTSQMKESEIPVNLDQAKKTAGGDSPWMRMLFSIGVVGIMGCGAFIWMRKNKKAHVGVHPAPEIQVLKMHHLGHKRSLAIIRVAGESILVGVTDHNISHIKTLSLLDEDVPTEVPQNFETVLRKNNTYVQPHLAQHTIAEDEEDFSISGIKDFVSSKLKNMRSIE
ncbi:MAG: hypothetical protein BroJett040_14350 [Oligoflexia bacterium]|nr:MAG: hypothetical protein BroJett040_14350 [Oligoflexia bacterium]